MEPNVLKMSNCSTSISKKDMELTTSLVHIHTVYNNNTLWCVHGICEELKMKHPTHLTDSHYKSNAQIVNEVYECKSCSTCVLWYKSHALYSVL